MTVLGDDQPFGPRADGGHTMIREGVKPALTAEEWSKILAGIAGHAILPKSFPERRHSEAALALYGQPFGFTWEDVDFLNGLLSGKDRTSDASFIAHTLGWHTDLMSLRDRIAALLPPRPESSSDGGTQDDDTVVPT